MIFCYRKNRRKIFMKSVSKKLLSVVLAVLMVVSCAAVAFAADADFDYSTNEDGSYAVAGLLVDDIGEDGVLTLPVQQPDDGETYVSVDEEAFMYDGDTSSVLNQIVSVIVPANIKNVGPSAFEGLPNLTSVTFKGDIVLENRAFANCPALESVTFEGDVTLNDEVFADCASLGNISVNEDAKILTSRSALETTKWFMTWVNDKQPDYIMLGTTLVAYKGTDTEKTIPLNVTVIGAGAFMGNGNIEKIVISKYVNTIGKEAFKNCSALKEVVYSDYGEITTVGAAAFENTPYFDDFEGEFFTVGTILVKYKGDNAKAYVRIPNTITEIADDAFLGNYLISEDGYTFVISSITVPASVKKFGENCFALAQLDNGKYYSPRLYAYAGTAVIDELKKAGYLVSVCKNPADVNGDSKVDVNDARLALRIAVKLDLADDSTFGAADINGDGKVTVDDARTIIRLAVNLENYTAKDLLLMPTTDFEILQAYTKAVKTVARYNAGYTKTVSSKVTDKDVNAQHKNRLLKLVNTGAVNTSAKFEPDTQAAIDNLTYCSLISTKTVKNAYCSVDENDNYVVTIVLKDVNDAKLTFDNDTYTEAANEINKVMPVVSGTDFYNAFYNSKDGFGKNWFQNWVPDNDKRTTPCVRYYSLDYTEPTVKATFDRETFKLSSVELGVNYKFSIDGRMDGIDISGKFFKVGDATFTRHDTIAYSDFTF